MSEGKDREMPQLQEREFALPSPLVPFGPLTDCGGPGVTCFTQSTDGNAHLSCKHPDRHTGNNVLSALRASLTPIRLTHEINHHDTTNRKYIKQHFSNWELPTLARAGWFKRKTFTSHSPGDWSPPSGRRVVGSNEASSWWRGSSGVLSSS